MQSLKDKALELVSIAEGAILRREATILALRKKVAELERKLGETQDQPLKVRPSCEHCAYRIIGLKILEKEGKEK